MLETLQGWISGLGAGSSLAGILARLAAVALVAILGFLANLVTKRLIVAGLRYVIRRTATTRDDVLVKRKVFTKLSHLASASVVYALAPFALEGEPHLIALAQGLGLLYMVVAAVLVVDSILNAVQDIYETFNVSRDVPIRSFVQIIKVAVYFLGVILVVSVLLGKDPLYLLGGLGAMTAVLMLVFKDAILGFVAGIQLTANKMVARGDWIEMPRYGADGDVTEISLTTVKVQNWDKTITTIPTYALITESFKNWRGMQISGGRRIKRSIYIDMNTVKFCDDEMLERFSRIQFIREYIEKKKQELAAWNAEQAAVDESPANGRRLTNIGTFRAYVMAYLQNHPMINREMTFLVRQLAPTPQGLPIEIYVFCKDKAWANYEAIQADIFDHILAVIPQFDLQVYQTPSGSDFRKLGAAS